MNNGKFAATTLGDAMKYHSYAERVPLRPGVLDCLADAIDGDATDRDSEEAGEAALSGTEGESNERDR